MSISLEVGVEGVDEILEAFRDAPRVIEEELEDGVLSALGVLTREMQVYPPERPGQRYVRTYKLREGWANPEIRIRLSGETVAAVRARNTVPYGPFVQHPDEQAWMHVGRWQTTDQVMNDKESEIQQKLARVIRDAVRRIQRGER